MNRFLIHEINSNNSLEHLSEIGFDSAYKNKARFKYEFKTIKIKELSCPQATILKQIALSLGTDAAIHRDVLVNKTEKTDVLLTGSISQLKQIAEKLNHQEFSLPLLGEEIIKFLENKTEPLKIKNKVFDWKKPYLMGILNITPDSFSDGNEFFTIEKAIEHFNKLKEDGADIIDIGAESTRPNATPVSPQEEQSRLIPVIKAIRDFDKETIISIDTRNAETARICLDLGADIINDISGLDHDSSMIKVIQEYKCPLILGHFKTQNADFINDSVIKELYAKAQLLEYRGLQRNQIILDPGIGFGKTVEENLTLIKQADELISLAFPTLYGVSRKSFIQKTLDLDITQTEPANLAIATILASKGANFLRVHNVKSHKETLAILEHIL